MNNTVRERFEYAFIKIGQWSLHTASTAHKISISWAVGYQLIAPLPKRLLFPLKMRDFDEKMGMESALSSLHAHFSKYHYTISVYLISVFLSLVGKTTPTVIFS